MCFLISPHLGAVEHHRPHDVAVNATVEAPDALVAHELLGSVDDAGGLLAFTGHHLGLEDVKGVAGEGAEGAGGGAGSKLLDEGGVLRGGAAEGDLAGLCVVFEGRDKEIGVRICILIRAVVTPGN